ncbi:uncharacterized protein LOC117175509 [Belonocnema kinseyi]|uniref:uncharacterized protein LOC117175509 n=1 Tax=Belonocnema kinseyi TaxID=2817044 RepID=UPI00143D3D39|nr:uncharacterized protein LOC117175509 [Belonocnema kinseyi]
MERKGIFYVIIVLALGYVHSNLFKKSANYDFGNFNDKAGVYFQEMDQAHFYHDRYRIITFLDIRKNLILEASFSSYCERFKSSCTSLKTYSKVYKEQRTMAFNMLGMNAEEDMNSSLIITLFGTFHDQDVIYYDEWVTPFLNSSARIKTIDNQTVIVNSTFGTIFPTFSDSDDEFRLNEFYVLFEQWTQEISTLTTAILFARMGKLYPEILPPSELIDVLKNASLSFKDISWPYEPEIHNYEEIINISDLRVALINGTLLFDMLVPMVDTGDYLEPSFIYKIVPFPIKLSARNLYFFTQPRARYVALRYGDSPDLLLTEQQFQECKNTKYFKLCSSWHPSSISKLDYPCEDSLITGKDDVFFTCPIRLIKSKRTFWYKINNNAWIFSTPNSEVMNVVCPGNEVNQQPISVEVSLENYGWLELNKSCYAESNNVFLRPHETFNNSHHVEKNRHLPKVNILQDVEEYLQKLDVSLDGIFINDFGNYSHVEPEYLKLIGTPLAQVKIQADNLKNLIYQKKMFDEHEEKIAIQVTTLKNLKDKIEQQSKVIEKLMEQMNGSEDLRREQIFTWVYISILSFIILLCVLYLTKCYQKMEDCFRKNRSFRSFRFRNSGTENCINEVDCDEGESTLRENAFRTLL